MDIFHAVEGYVDSFYKTILSGTLFKLCSGDKKEFMEDGTSLKDVIGEEFYEELFAKKDCLDLNLPTFEHQCHKINNFLIEKCLFQQVHKLKKKFRYLIKRDPLQKKVRRDLSVCVEK